MNNILKKSSHETRFIIKTVSLYCMLSMAFSFTGILLAEKGPVPNPVGSLTAHEVIGHVLWGLVAGAVTLSLRYTILSGLFAVLIDSDHIIGLTHLEALTRMSHSIFFGVMSSILLMILFGRKDYRLGSIAFAGMLAHLSFDIFADYNSKFPLLAPLYNHQISFSHETWFYFEIIAIIIIGVATFLQKNNTSKIATRA